MKTMMKTIKAALLLPLLAACQQSPMDVQLQKFQAQASVNLHRLGGAIQAGRPARRSGRRTDFGTESFFGGDLFGGNVAFNNWDFGQQQQVPYNNTYVSSDFTEQTRIGLQMLKSFSPRTISNLPQYAANLIDQLYVITTYQFAIRNYAYRHLDTQSSQIDRWLTGATLPFAFDATDSYRAYHGFRRAGYVKASVRYK